MGGNVSVKDDGLFSVNDNISCASSYEAVIESGQLHMSRLDKKDFSIMAGHGPGDTAVGSDEGAVIDGEAAAAGVALGDVYGD